jgi:hypothetical protein
MAEHAVSTRARLGVKPWNEADRQASVHFVQTWRSAMTCVTVPPQPNLFPFERVFDAANGVLNFSLCLVGLAL